MTEDSELLRQYAEERSEAAFTELVRRRIDLVFSVALRQGGGDAQLAEDVTQQIFIALARKARTLSRHPSLGGWLYRATQYAATDAVRADRRRRGREQETTDMHETFVATDGTPDWEKLRPMLDVALGELGRPDRDAVSLRFFEGRTFGDIGRILSLNEDAARKRVDRALDRLHGRLSRIGVTSSMGALANALTSQVNAAAPASLAANVAFAAISGTTLIGSASVGSAFLHLMNTTKITLSAISVVALLGIGAALFEQHQVHSYQDALTDAKRQNDDLLARLRRSERSLAAANADTSVLLKATDNLRPGSSPPSVAFVKTAEIQARLRRAHDLAKSGNWDEALKEYLWLFDEGMKKSGSFYAVRLTMVSEIAKLGQSYPAALTALQDRRDQMAGQLQAGDDNFNDVAEYVALNKSLGDGSRSLAFYDQLAPDDRLRHSLANSLYGEFVAGQRYSEAAQARTYSAMVAQFQNRTQWPVSANPDSARSDHTYMITATADDVEVLAGANKITEAQQLAASLLAYDGSGSTRASLQARAARAGHPDLLATLPNR